jgi:hypothetical protein
VRYSPGGAAADPFAVVAAGRCPFTLDGQVFGTHKSMTAF